MNSHIKRVKNRLDRLKNLSNSRRFYAFLVCLAVSTCIWLLIALSKHYTTIIRFPVHYANLPATQVVTNELPTEVSLEVRSYGFQLLSYKLFSTAPLIIDASDYESKPLGNIYTSYVLTPSLLNEISEQLGGETSVSRIWPDTIFMRFSDVMERQFEVRPLIQLSFKDQYKQFGEIEVRPSTVYVRGPVSVLDTMQYLYTNLIKMDNVDKNVTKYINYTISGIKDVSFGEHPTAFVTVPVDEFTQGSAMVKVIPVNVPAGYDYKVFPSEVEVIYNVGMKDYDAIDPSMFQAVVELRDSAAHVDQTALQVYLTRHPNQVQLVGYEPREAEVILRPMDNGKEQ